MSDYGTSQLIGNAPVDSDQAAIAYALAHLMSEISETSHAAGWISDLEFDLWAELHGQSIVGKRLRQATFGISDNEKSVLRSLSKLCNGWIVYGSHGAEYVPLSEWIPMYEKAQDAKRARIA